MAAVDSDHVREIMGLYLQGRLFADGMSMPDIAETVGIGYRSVRSYLDEATRKLGAANSRQAASIAIRLGLI